MKSICVFFLVSLVAAEDSACLDCEAQDSHVLLQSRVEHDRGVEDSGHGEKKSGEVSKVVAKVRGDLLDVTAMAVEIQQDAAANVDELQLKVDGLKPALDSAKAKFKADRKTIRDNYRKCRKKITWNPKTWKDKSECAPFVPHFSLVQAEDEEELATQEEENAEGRRRRRRRRRKADPCNGRDKCELRQAKRRAKAAAKEDFKNTRKSFRDFKKQLRKAKFQKNILPKVLVLLKPELTKALSQVDMSDSSSGQVKTCEKALTEEESTDCIPLAEITAVDLLKNYMNVQLHGQMKDHFEKLFKKIKEGVWKFFDPLKDSVKNSLVAAVGTTPVVGGALAVAVGVLMDLVYKAIKYGVEKALDDVSKLMQGQIVQAIVTAVFNTGLFTPDALQNTAPGSSLATQLETAGNTAQQSAESTSLQEITNEAANAQAAATSEAAGAQSSITTEGNTVKDGEDADDQEDEDQYEAEDSEDIVDEDDD